MGLLHRVVVVAGGAVGVVGAVGAVDAVGAVGALVVCGDGVKFVVTWESMSGDEWKWIIESMSVWILLYIGACVC